MFAYCHELQCWQMAQENCLYCKECRDGYQQFLKNVVAVIQKKQLRSIQRHLETVVEAIICQKVTENPRVFMKMNVNICIYCAQNGLIGNIPFDYKAEFLNVTPTLANIQSLQLDSGLLDLVLDILF